MRRARVGVLLVAAAAALVAGGAATNQVLGGGKVSWNWAYVAVGFMVLASVLSVQVAQPSGPPAKAARWTLGRRRSYLRQLRASVVDMETIGVVTHGEFVLRMRQVYVDVSLRPRPVHDAAHDAGVGLAVGQPVGERRPLRSFLGTGRIFAVIGTSGSGKTTLVRHTALALCGWHWRFWQRRQLPVLLYLRDHAQSIIEGQAPGLATIAASAGWLDGKAFAGWLDGRLDKGRCVVLLDGLDEVADEKDRRKVVAWVRRQIARYPANSFIMTSRPHGYLDNPIPNADVLQVQRFSAAQISEFLQQWSYAVESRSRGGSGKQVRIAAKRQASDLLRKLREGPAIYELAANPLLLTMIANVHRYRGALPRSRAALYAEMCDALIHRRQEAKNLTDATGLEGPKKELVMRHLALHMMRERVRDISDAAAQHVIRQPLDQVAGEHEVTPAIFLEEVRKSGLLVGSEHGVHAFAHLTFQEYLAAACIRDQSGTHGRLLTEGVDDPWWRETTLLWAAGSDATPVIDACLRSGTIGALTLAFDCADEALQVDRGTRGHLNDLLDASDASDEAGGSPEARRRLIAAVTASRGLRQFVWQGTTAVCAQPVSHDLYGLFVLHERADGRSTPALPVDKSREPAPAVGMWADDATRFVDWLNTLFDDGPVYRLPVPVELADPDAALVPVMARQTVWTGNGRGPFLYRTGAVPWPYTPTQEQLAEFPADLLGCLRPALRLAEGPWIRDDDDLVFDLDRIVAYLQVFAPMLGTDPLAAPDFERAMALNRARDLVHTIEMVRDLLPDLKRVHRDGVESARDIAAGLNNALDEEIALICELETAADGRPSAAIMRVLGRVRSPGSDLDGLMRDLTGLLDHDLVRAVDRARDRVRRMARGVDDRPEERVSSFGRYMFRRAGELDRDRARALERDLARRQGVAGDLDLARARRLARDLAAAVGRSAATRDGDMAYARHYANASARLADLDRALRREIGHELAYDLARGLSVPPEFLLSPMVESTDVLLRNWPASTQAGDGQAMASFERFVAKITRSTVLRSRATEDPAGVMDRVRQRVVRTDTDRQAYSLISSADDLIALALRRTAQADWRTLTVAGGALLAAIILLQKHEDGDLMDMLGAVLGALIAMGGPRVRDNANEVLLLVRT